MSLITAYKSTASIIIKAGPVAPPEISISPRSLRARGRRHVFNIAVSFTSSTLSFVLDSFTSRVICAICIRLFYDLKKSGLHNNYDLFVFVKKKCDEAYENVSSFICFTISIHKQTFIIFTEKITVKFFEEILVLYPKTNYLLSTNDIL